MQNPQPAVLGGSVMFGMIISHVIVDGLKEAGQPFWLRVMIAALVAGVLAGGFAYLAGRIWRQ